MRFEAEQRNYMSATPQKNLVARMKRNPEIPGLRFTSTWLRLF